MEEETLEVRKIYLSYKHSKLGALKEEMYSEMIEMKILYIWIYLYRYILIRWILSMHIDTSIAATYWRCFTEGLKFLAVFSHCLRIITHQFNIHTCSSIDLYFILLFSSLFL